jgi:hypothetical protein
MQQIHIVLTRELGGVEAVNHVGTGPCIARQGDHIHALSIHESIHDAGMPQAVQGARRTVDPLPETSVLHEYIKLALELFHGQITTGVVCTKHWVLV